MQYKFQKSITFFFTFRSTQPATDVWNELEINWNNFYWLTGEVPPTLERLCEELVMFFGCKIMQGKYTLSFRNQVSINLCVCVSFDMRY